jgi:alpha-beta hydrolase superfamily lysophospholipase
MKHSTVIIVLILTLSGATVFAQQAKTTSGTYTTYVGDQLIGTDTYTLATNADGSAQTQSEVSFGPTKFKATTIARQNKPVSFKREAAGAPTILVEFINGMIRNSTEGQPVSEVKGQPTVLLENGAWEQFLLLFAQYDYSSTLQQTFDAYVPSQGVPFTLNLQRIDSPSFKVGSEQVATQHFLAGTSLGLGFEMWTDTAHVPQLILIPAQQVRVVRKGSEALAEVISAAPVKKIASANDPYTSEEVTFQNGGQNLAGTLTIPKKGSAPFPAVAIISGSGSQDRDGSAVANLYRLIAEHLSANGVAVLRADDRGVGKSVPLQPNTSYRDLINDSKAAFEYLFKRPDIDHRRIAMAGHSEGALTALVIAAEDPRVAAIMVLAGGSRGLDRILLEQTLNGLALQSPINPSDRTRYPAVVTQLDKVFTEVRSKPQPADPAKDPLAYFRQHLEIDPLAFARRVKVPTLILNGERDDNVLPYHALELAQAMAGSGNKQVLLRIFPNLTHLFTPSTRDKAVTSAQAMEVSVEFLDLLQRWAANVLVNGRDGGSVPDK